MLIRVWTINMEEPKELANVDASAIAALLPGFERGVELTQLDMFNEGELAA